MKITVTDCKNYYLATLDGYVNESAKEQFDEHLHAIVEIPGNRLLIDLSGADRINSLGIGFLVTLVSRANAKGSRVVLTQPSAFVNAVFQATKLTKFFDVESDLNKAIVRLSGES